MDNKILEKLIKNYDDNVLYLEQADEARQKSSIISTNLRRLLMNLAKEESNAQAVMDELVSYLQNFTKTKQKAKRELDFVRVEADRLGYGFEPLARVYAQEFYPAAKQAGFKIKDIHNLFIALLYKGYKGNFNLFRVFNSIRNAAFIIFDRYITPIIRMKNYWNN